MALFSAIEQKIIDILSDGQRHTREELHSCLYDDQGSFNNIQAHISNIRKKIRLRGEDINCVIYSGGIYYQHVRLLANPYRE